MLLAVVPQAGMAQKKGKKPVKAKVVVVEKTAEQKLFESMVPATAKVMFVDSMVVDKTDFLKHIPLSKEAGSLSAGRRQFVYTNELGNHRIFAEGDTVSGHHLYTADRLGDTWSKPKQLTELDREVKDCRYPFLLSDGMTLFFAAKGEKSIGGYDIFMTMFNTESGTFYKPENYGLPFNSTANDYLIVFDDLHNLGWLVSDRYVPADKVCIYTFVPTNPRRNFGSDNLDEDKLTAYARLTSIRDTWSFGDRNSAMKRLESLTRRDAEPTDRAQISFAINDKTVYRSIDEFKSEKARQQYKQLEALKKQLAENETVLAKMRMEYSQSSTTKRLSMRDELLKAEKLLQQQRTDVREFEKTVRNTENRSFIR